MIKLQKLKYLLISFIFFIINSNLVLANDIKSIKMDIYLDNNGDAHITETWDADLDSGTEGYKPYYNLGNSTIKDFQVSLKEHNFTFNDYWNVNASFDEKKYQAGFNYIEDGMELCFGISEYGSNTYVLKYTITNFISKTEDADVLYWTLIPHELSDKPEHFYIKVYSDFAYEDSLDVWGFGYGDKSNEGYAYVYDGYIEMTKEGKLDSDEKVVLLVKFPKDTFNTSNVIEKDFDAFYDMAKENSTNYHAKDIIATIFSFIISLLPFVISIVCIIIALNQTRYGTKRLKFNKGAKNLKDAPYFRDIPCEKNIFKAYWIACEYNLIKNNTDFLGAILLKWLRDGNIENDKLDEKNKALKLVKSDNLTPLESELFTMMLEASEDGILEKNEFTKWCKKNYKEILNWFNKAIDNVTDSYVLEGLITKEDKTFGSVYHVDDKMKEEALKMAGLKKFLNEFSLISDRKAIEVKLWEEYLMYAQIFGIAKKVAKEFKRLYPDVLTDDYYDDIIFIHTISYEGVSAASVAKSRAESYSSGGGGFSSSGGGGGSFGGGSGGGGFR